MNNIARSSTSYSLCLYARGTTTILNRLRFCVYVSPFYTVQAKEESEERKEENLLIFFLDPISDAVTLTVLHGWANTLSR